MNHQKNKIGLIATLFALGLVISSFALSFVYTGSLPDKVPIHFGIDGTPDRWAAKSMIYLLPSVSVFTFLLLVAVGKFPRLAKKPWYTEEQNRKRFELSKSFMPWLNLLMCLMFFYIQWATIQTALGAATGLNPIIMVSFIGGILAYSMWFTIKVLRTK